MFGAIIGDIVGSRFEFNNIKSKEFEFFHEECSFTDDTICTAAVADILLHNLDPAPAMQKFCRDYQDFPSGGYGAMFFHWVFRSENPKPYGSFGNGEAMRMSPAAFLHRDNNLEDALAATERVTNITHNHEEGIKGAKAATHAIWLAFHGRSAPAIRETIAQEYGYDLSPTVDEIRPSYHFNETYQGTVPEAIICALESESFEDAARNAVSIGGDSDTLGAIAGPIAEALHGVEEHYIQTACDKYLDERIVSVLGEMYSRKENE